MFVYTISDIVEWSILGVIILFGIIGWGVVKLDRHFSKRPNVQQRDKEGESGHD